MSVGTRGGRGERRVGTGVGIGHAWMLKSRVYIIGLESYANFGTKTPPFGTKIPPTFGHVSCQSNY